MALYNRQAAPSADELGRLWVCGDIGYPLSLRIQIKQTIVELFNNKPFYIPPSNTSVFMMILPIAVFVFSQSSIVETMSSAGIKE